jgi:hypothetical protein
VAKSRCRPNQAASAHDVTLNAGPPRWLPNLSPAPLGLFRTAIPRPSADWSIVTIRAGRAARAVKKERQDQEVELHACHSAELPSSQVSLVSEEEVGGRHDRATSRCSDRGDRVRGQQTRGRLEEPSWEPASFGGKL